MDSKDDKHLVGGEPLRPEEQTSGQFVIDNFIGSFRDVSFTNRYILFIIALQELISARKKTNLIK